MKQWTAMGAKSIFPHSLFSSIEEIIAQKEFPPKEAFNSKLKQTEVPQEDYDEAKTLYETRLQLPEGHPDKWNNFSDWLEYYNMCDVEPLAHAISNQFAKFRLFFNIEPLIYLTLPSIASQAMWANFDQDCSHVVSFDKNNPHLSELFRNKGLIGGLVNLFARHVSCKDDAPPEARFINGERITNIISLDFNSLYLYSQDQNLPTTPGLHWTESKNGRYFNKKSLRTDVSFVSLQWLYWLQETDICVDRSGKRQRIHHGYHQGEICCECLKFSYQCSHKRAVDGYCNVDGEHIFFEFYGCRYHAGCSYCSQEPIDASRKEFDDDKKAIMRRKGRLEVMRECEWKDGFPTPIKTEMGRILFRDNEKSLLDAIKNDEVYGFVVCSVKTPLELIESYDILFPWIIQHLTITELSTFMRSQTDITEFNTLAQTYNGEDLLLLTTTIQFYMEIGLQIYNVKQVIQYKKG